MNNPSAPARPARFTALALVCLPLAIALLGAGIRVLGTRMDRVSPTAGAPPAACPCVASAAAANAVTPPSGAGASLVESVHLACVDLSGLADAPAH